MTETSQLPAVRGTARREDRARGARFNTRAGRAFDVANVVFLVLVGVLALAPFLFVLARSFASETELTQRPFFFWPDHFDLSAYTAIFQTPSFTRAVITTVLVTAVGTVIQLLLTVTMAYPLAKRDLPGRNFVLTAVVVTLVFSGGMIPTFLIVKELGLLNTYWALILPLAINPFSLIIVKNFFQNLPAELEESAKVDGATELQVLWRIVLPLSKPILATFALFYAVGIWNDFMSPLLYLNNSSMWTLQMFLQQVTAATDLTTAQQSDPSYIPPSQGIKYAVIVVATIPVLIFYPFLQKHFAKGMLIGAVKG
ncbi:carbohydrate ABC transporter permease [Humibacter sp.]|jgi:putative aldouronate transport system permease protein|uniref:carbohydrate ABC transporter permease n=1 Tax=Humibacter sp. TaxID=1940291 RepID=UPI002C32E903|nr:carbohydrate ABC transporter permease [Humibacter sp.]HVX06914.1 carbohydrate ABC transporter permease [Humibacter sp.]